MKRAELVVRGRAGVNGRPNAKIAAAAIGTLVDKHLSEEVSLADALFSLAADGPARFVPLFSRHAGDDVEEGLLVEGEQGVVVLWRCVGPTSRDVFGEDWHVGLAWVRGDLLTRLQRALASRALARRGSLSGSDSQTVALASGLKAFFRDEARKFSDLLDLMDEESVAYAYASVGPRGMASRRQQADDGRGC